MEVLSNAESKKSKKSKRLKSQKTPILEITMIAAVIGLGIDRFFFGCCEICIDGGRRIYVWAFGMGVVMVKVENYRSYGKYFRGLRV